MTSSQIAVERLTVYSNKDAAGIGRIMPFLSEKFDGSPVRRELLEMIINSPSHEQIVARFEDRIVGAATMNLLLGAGSGGMGYLEEFVIDPGMRRMGIGSKMWDEMKRWCEERGVDFELTSNPRRVDAHSFYLAHGATIRETNVFHVSTKRV